MAEDINKKVIVDVDVRDQGVTEATEKINLLRKALNDLMAKQSAELAQGKSHTAAYRTRAEIIDRYKKRLDEATKSLKDLSDEEGKAEKNSDGLADSNKEAGKSFVNLGGAISQVAGEFLRLVGIKLIGPISVLTLYVKGLKAAFDEVADAVRRNEDRAYALERVLLPVTTAYNNFRRSVGSAVESLLDFAETNSNKVIPALQGFLAAIGSINPVLKVFTDTIGRAFGEDFTEQLNAETEAYARRRQLVLDTRTAEVDLAKLRNEQTELNAIVYDKERETIESRRQAIVELGRNAKDQYNIRKNLIEQEIVVLNDLALTDEKEAAANLDRLASLKASLEDITSTMNIQDRTINRFNTELAREEARRRATALREAQTQAKKEQQILEDNEKIRLTLLRQGFETELAALRSYYDVRASDLQRRLDTELNLNDNARRMLLEQIELLKEQESNQTKELFAGWKNELLKQSGLAAEAQINEINSRYTTAIKNLDSIQSPERLIGESDEDFTRRAEQYERFLFDRYELEIRLEREKNLEIRNIEYADLQRRHAEIETEISREYENDLAAFARNQAEQLNILEESLNKQIEAKRAANLVTYDEENRLAEIAAQRRLNELNLQLDNNETSFKAQYDARKRYLELELEAYAGNIEEEARLLRELRDLEREWWTQRIDALQEYSDTAISIASSVSDVISNLATQELNQAKKDNSEWKKDLKSRYDAGLISREYYNSQVEKADEELAAKELEIARAKAKREQQIRLFEIAIDTLAGVAKAVSQSPLTFGLPWSAFVTATGAAQAAAVATKPLPVAERGMYVKGKRHSSGGEIVNVEDGEMIINRHSVAMFPDLLSSINQIGGGIPFTSSSSDGGFAGRSVVESANSGSDTSEVLSALQNARFIIDLETFRDVEKTYINSTAKGNLRV